VRGRRVRERGPRGGAKFARGGGMQVCPFTLRAVKGRLFEISGHKLGGGVCSFLLVYAALRY
jgi:hypothetical protein